jgi:hypothetical protein
MRKENRVRPQRTSSETYAVCVRLYSNYIRCDVGQNASCAFLPDDLTSSQFMFEQVFKNVDNTLRDHIDELRFRSQTEKHELSHQYEAKIKNMGNAGRNGGEYYTPRPHSLGKMLDKAKNKGEPQRYLRNFNVRWFGFDLSDLLEMRFLPEEAGKIHRHERRCTCMRGRVSRSRSHLGTG